MEQTLERSEARHLDQICADLLRCQKVISIYPLEHPRVKSTLEDMSAAITAQADRLDGSVSMDTAFLEDIASLLDGLTHREAGLEYTAANYRSLARLLKSCLIQEVRFDGDPLHEELYEFSCLLHEDFAAAASSRLDRYDPATWTTIKVWFYTPEEFPDHVEAGRTAARWRRDLEAFGGNRESPERSASTAGHASPSRCWSSRPTWRESRSSVGRWRKRISSPMRPAISTKIS